MKKIRLIIPRALSLLLILGLLAVCSGQSQRASTSDEKATKETKDSAEASKDYAARKKAEYQKKIESQLDEFSRGIDELKMKAEQSGAKAKAELNKEIAALEQQKEVVSKKLSELQSSGAEAWEYFKSRVDSAMKELKKSYDRTVSRFKERQ